MRNAVTAAIAAVLVASFVPASSASAAQDPPECTPREPGGPMWVTADCVDPLYGHPVVDSEADLTTPIPHHKVSGHFEGTNKRFTFYFPPKSRWQGRFFHYVYPLQDENATAESVTFGADSGAYTVQTNGGGGYRVDAAAAKFAETVAARYYRAPSRRIHGYVYGGSGGSFQTIGGIENSTGVWDGAVPFIIGLPTSIPNNFFVRAFARLVLRDAAPRIADAVRPGGSGDPYAGLTDVERAVLREVTSMGVPLRAWDDYPYLLGLTAPDGLLGFAGTVRGMDPTYADDFWARPGYLGTERSPLGDVVRAAKVDHVGTITQVDRDADDVPTSVVIGAVPPIETAVGLDYTLYAADGITRVGTLSGSLDPATRVFTIGSGNPASVLTAIDAGAKLRIDNRWSVALTSYHRHQVPTLPGFHAWDQFRAADGTPIHPQRPIQIGPLVARNVAGGGSYTGAVNGKVIVVVNLLDVDAYPWHADWYAQRVRQALGDRFDNSFRVWYNDNADHLYAAVNGPRAARLVDYGGILQQALRDVSRWVEQGVAPAASTRYRATDGQVAVPANAAARRGLQPVVDLTVDRAARIDITAGQTVTFHAKVQVPPGAGTVVATEWDFLGTGDFAPAAFGPPRRTVLVRARFTYPTPGTYFPVLRATAQREGDPGTPFTRVPNLGRVRVVVR